ncbi:hypothetical protein BJ878DRAFT_455542 [Calycina marina]|uniref:CENP-V/GFA domain-containing protein n=1 Tax=Calycina marina TaxID=1763456 RepID=A0A9P7Z7N6_9HELO|nr:hypothetical protein BJ878DRAFT_455542 [Calycina marina]
MSSQSTNTSSYTGSCHCGLTKYVINLPLPPSTAHTRPPPPAICIRKCNCTTCQNLPFFHIRLSHAPSQFTLLSPLTLPLPLQIALQAACFDYICFSKNIHWHFCLVCGVRCFAHIGEGEMQNPPSEVKEFGLGE